MPWNKPSKWNTKNSGSSMDKTLHFVVEEAHNLLPAPHKCGHLITVYLPPVSACRNSLIPVSNDSVGRWHSMLCKLLSPSTMSIKDSSTNAIAKKCKRLGKINCTTLILFWHSKWGWPWQEHNSKVAPNVWAAISCYTTMYKGKVKHLTR